MPVTAQVKQEIQGAAFEIKSSIYQEYNDAVVKLAPDLKYMGTVVGDNMLSTLLIPMKDQREKRWREDIGRLSIYPETTKMVIKPVLQPFVDGLWEPFEGFLGKWRTEIYCMMA